jgi:hypothetical protein
MYEVISESDKCKMRTKGFKDGLISRGEIRVEIGEKKFYTIKSEKHELILKEVKRTINPENNNKRQIIGKYISVPYGYRRFAFGKSRIAFSDSPSNMTEEHRTSNEHNIRSIIESFSGKEILSYDNKEQEPCDDKYPPMSDLLIAKLLGDN